MRLASFLEKHKSITLSGTKRFSEKSGEYYLKNVILEKKNNEKKKLCKKISLTKTKNLNNCINKFNTQLSDNTEKIDSIKCEDNYTKKTNQMNRFLTRKK